MGTPLEPDERPTARSELASRAGREAHPSAWVLTISAEGIQRVVPLDRELVIGRSRTADVFVDHASLSRHHARVRPPRGPGTSPTIEDLSSANGTRVGTRIVAPGEEVTVSASDWIELGRVVVSVRASQLAVHPRQIWVHDYFESLLDAECARADATGSRLAVVRFSFTDAPPAGAVQVGLLGAFRAHDVIGYYAPCEYEVLIVGTPPTEVDAIARDAVARLGAQGLTASVGVACHRRDGVVAAELLRAADLAARPEAAAAGGEPQVVSAVPMAALEETVARVAAGVISVLIEGETGVGKEVLAQRIHRASPRADKPMVTVHCAALAPGLMESALFGHVRGAFTGATDRALGHIAAAEGGTLFLDEVGEIPLAVQVKLLRVLEDRVVTPVGATQGRRVDVRFVAATNRDLDAEVAQGAFRADLYFRLAAVTLWIPPLRERPDEISALAAHFIDAAARAARLPAVPTLGPGTLDELTAYSWPGNIRELRNMMERAVLVGGGATILPEHLPLQRMRSLRLAAEAGAPSGPSDPPATAHAPDEIVDDLADRMRRELEAVERRFLEEALRHAGGLQAEAAQLLGVSRRTLINKMERFGIARPLKDRRHGGE